MDKSPAAPIVSVTYPDAPGVVTRRRQLAADFHVEPHWHERAQLLYASHGVMRVTTPRRLWIVPPTRALWIPAQVVHEIRMSSAVDMRSLYIDAGLVQTLPADCAVLEVTPLMRELVVRITTTGQCGGQHGGPPGKPDTFSADHELLSALLVAELGRLAPRAFDLPLPQSADLRALCVDLLHDLSLAHAPQQAAARMGVSTRTLYRRFLDETGLSYTRWVQQARLLEAVRRLAEGVPVTTVALDLGYQSPSAFSAMFHRQLGSAPRQWR
ncbi:AraC family transcriptional regulator [Pseudomonadota bacterium AL_CKDN230030165-1A_HGKHYDSX7]